MTFTIRVTLDDRPGALASIASALGGIGANIVELDVLERSVDRAVDRIVVQAPGSVGDEVRSIVEEVPGTTVDALHPTVRNAGLPPLGLGVRLALVTDDQLLATLVDGLVLTFEATWSAVVRRGEEGPTVVARSPATPSSEGLSTPWLPLRDVRRVPDGGWAPTAWAGDDEPPELAAAPLRSADEAVLVARPDGPRFARRELADLGMLADLAGGLLRRPPGTATGASVGA